MKSIRSFLIGSVLALFIAGMAWLDVHAPPVTDDTVFLASQPQETITGNRASTREASEAPLTAVDNHLAESETAIPQGWIAPEEMKTASTSLPTQAASCADGPLGSGSFLWPTDNRSLTGHDYGPDHPGIDIAAGEGSPVYAADAGVAIALGNDAGGYGNMILIDHHNGYLSLYAHLSMIGVGMCQGVVAGQWIGAAGSTGNAYGAHLHFGIEKDGMAIDPWSVLP